jgi:hypothetical protein
MIYIYNNIKRYMIHDHTSESINPSEYHQQSSSNTLDTRNTSINNNK